MIRRVFGIRRLRDGANRSSRDGTFLRNRQDDYMLIAGKRFEETRSLQTGYMVRSPASGSSPSNSSRPLHRQGRSRRRLLYGYPSLCGIALSSIVRSRHTQRWMLSSGKEVHSILETLYANTVDEINNLAVGIIDHLTKLGFESYRHILERSRPERPADFRDRERSIVPELFDDRFQCTGSRFRQQPRSLPCLSTSS